MVTQCKEISKEVYERSLACHHMITIADYNEVFSESEIIGYGLYGNRTYKDGDKYYVQYQTGTSCD